MAQAQTERSLYVSATGDDSNNGRSEGAAYKTLRKAVEAASAGVVKTITIIGRIDGGWYYPDGGQKDINAIINTGSDEILITGKPGEGSILNQVKVESGKIRFTHIRLIGDDYRGYIIPALDISSPGTVTLGTGVVVSGIVRFSGISLVTMTMTDDAIITGSKSTRETIGHGVIIGENGNASITMSGNSQITGNEGCGIYFEKEEYPVVRRKINAKIAMSGNASITNNSGRGIGGGIATVTMSGNSKVSNNKDGGIYCSELTMSENAEISSNTTQWGGGGVYVDGKVTMSGNAKIIDNMAQEDGGGVYGLVTISGNAVISGNKAETGGGVYGLVTISGNAEISGNTAKNGGGIYINPDRRNTSTQDGGKISGNKAEFGAGVYVSQGTFTLKKGTVTGNEAEFVGGGVYVKQGGVYNAQGGSASGNKAGDGGDDVFRQ
jgi:hypothetical protein